MIAALLAYHALVSLAVGITAATCERPRPTTLTDRATTGIAIALLWPATLGWLILRALSATMPRANW